MRDASEKEKGKGKRKRNLFSGVHVGDIVDGFHFALFAFFLGLFEELQARLREYLTRRNKFNHVNGLKGVHEGVTAYWLIHWDFLLESVGRLTNLFKAPDHEDTSCCLQSVPYALKI